MMRPYLLAAFAALVTTGQAWSQSPAQPLFAKDAPLKITLKADFPALTRASADQTPRVSGILSDGSGQGLSVQLQPRGITRRSKDVCQFPPIRVRFEGAPPASSVFAGQKQLKLVTHCRAALGFNQYTLLEYSAYRIYNQLTPLSFRVRLALVDYVDNSGKVVASRYGFFIEDADDVAKRNGMREANMGERFAVSRLSPTDAARFGLFEYMIGNLDWAMQAGPAGDQCCHNSKPIGVGGAAAQQIVPVPYDFDFAGMVNAPYATPPFGVPVSNIRQRRYRGLCRHNDQARALYPAFRAQRAQLPALLASIPGLDRSSQSKAITYLDGFFADIATDEQAAAKILKTCLG
ncbi:MAG: hypothetical protein ABI412_05120 [Sphingomicrobium sp.]